MECQFEIGQTSQEEKEKIIALLKDHTAQVGGVVTDNKQISILGKHEGKLTSIAVCYIFWNWLFVDLVWVDEILRGQGIGKALMDKVEETAREKKLTGLYLWTESWQAPEFYKKLGFEEFVEFKDFPPGHKRFGFRKYL